MHGHKVKEQMTTNQRKGGSQNHSAIPDRRCLMDQLGLNMKPINTKLFYYLEGDFWTEILEFETLET